MSSTIRRALAVTSALGIAASALVLAGVPAQSQEQKTGIGSGRAVIHIDAPTATVVKTGKNSYRMVLPPDSSGQWMGERTNAAGVTQTRVGDLTATRLSTKWTKFRYTSQGVLSTLAWTTSEGPSTALVRLSQPKVTDAGVRFDFTSKFTIPSRLKDVSINLQRAPEGSQRASGKAQPRSTDSNNFHITGDLWIGSNFDYFEGIVSSVSTRIYNASNNNTCWTGNGAYVIQSGSSDAVSVTTNTCANITYQNQFIPASSTATPYGVTPRWPGATYPGSLTYFLLITPSGQAQYKFTQSVVSWS
ncbi:MAG: hypothetical protein ACR2KE_08755 [Candidatus Nanopelagicales bacterium]